MDPIQVDVRDEPSKLAELAAGVPPAVRRAQARSGLWRGALAFSPSPILLWAFELPGVAVVWTIVAVLGGLLLYAVEQEVPKAGLTPGRISVDEHGLSIERETQRERWRGAAIREVVEVAEAIVVVSHQDGWLVIPRASFASRVEFERFAAAVRSQLETAAPTPGWPSRPPVHWGAVAFLLACAGGLAWLAWDATFWQRLPSAALAGVCVVIATADMASNSQRRLGGRTGRPTPPKPGSDGSSETWIAAVRLEQLRPSGSLVLGVYVLAAALLYVTLVAGMVGEIVLVPLVLLLIAFATFECANVLEARWPSRPVRCWRQLEATSLGIVRRHAGGSVTVAWTKLGEPVVKDDAIGLRWPGGGVFEDIPTSAFASIEERDAFVAVARSREAG